MAVSVLLCLSQAACTGDSRPVVFNRVSEVSPAGGNLAREHFGKLYRVVEVDDRAHRYTAPKYLSGLERSQPAHPRAQCLPANAWVLFVVTPEGAVTSPYVVNASATLPPTLAIARVEGMRFQPASLDGKPIPAVADFHLQFLCPGQR
jgi:hypothetical protein